MIGLVRRGYKIMESIVSSNLIELFDEVGVFKGIDASSSMLCGADRSYKVLFTLNMFAKNNKSVIFVCQNDYEAKRYYSEFVKYLSEDEVLYYPKEPIYFTFADSFSTELTKQRLKLEHLARGDEKKIILTSIWAMSEKRLFAKKDRQFTISLGESLDQKDLVDRLISFGYTREDLTEAEGQFSVRGGLVDLFSPMQAYPCRLEFFGDEIDSIREYNPDTQISINKMESAFVGACTTLLVDEEMKDKMLTAMREDAKKSLARIKDEKQRLDAEENSKELFSKLELNENELFRLGYVYLKRDMYSVLELFNDCHVILSETGQLKTNYENTKKSVMRDFTMLLEGGLAYRKQKDIFYSYEQIIKLIESCGFTALSCIDQSAPQIHLREKINVSCIDSISFNGNIQIAIKQIGSYLQSGYKTIVCYENDSQKKALENLFEAYSLKLSSKLGFGKLSIREAKIMSGCDFVSEKIYLLAYSDIVREGEKKKEVTKAKRTKEEFFSDIALGDYVVHENYGIGRYAGIHQLTLEGITKDHVKIEYASEDTLYVSTEHMDLISKYIGEGDAQPKLNKLSGNDWANTKRKASNTVKELASEYIKMYAERQNAKGYMFSEDNSWQYEFESAFEYEPTIDQINSIDEIKKDMQSSVPMDRLLCGDVGYGKTEVAQRACFKAVLDSKQVAVLVPTTVLALQHYNNFIERFKTYPVKIEMLTRFRTAKEIKAILEKLALGEIDILIGTHKLLSKNVVFKNLGLLVVDEEQRFGVSQKEKLKLLKKNVDCLSLSATPIPRTLHMSMIGIRDMSTISVPPTNRLQTQTYVMEQDDIIVRSAIENELLREGQVFYLFNRVDGIEQKAKHISELVEGARVQYAHGQMSKEELESVIMDFLSHKFDVLVCTTIIENGMDITNANTMIIEDADRLGLSQLYQLRGRVGRSSRMSYAYFMYRTDKVLNENAQKRLKCMKEFTKFGSGFKIAMRDLQIRGAGNLLGANQHGHFHNVGYDMYCKLLAKEVTSQMGQTPTVEKRETEINIKINAYIPNSYIEAEQQRISMYHQIALIKTREDIDELTEVLIDRYSEPPKPVLNLLEVAYLKALAEKANIRKILQKDNIAIIEFHNDVILDVELMQTLAKIYRIKLRSNALVPTLWVEIPSKLEVSAFYNQLIDRLIV